MQQSFNFFKLQGPYKINIFLNVQKPSLYSTYIKEQSPKKNLKLIFFVNCFVFKKMGNIVFDLHNSKYIFLVYLHIKLIKKIKENLPPDRLQKCFLHLLLLLFLG